MRKPSVIAVLTAFNRRTQTLAALEAYFAQVGAMSLSAVLVDDGSRDGTAAAVESAFPQVKVLRGDGSLYWNGGMAKAYREALSQGADYYLWLNDDSILFPDALSRLIADAQEAGAACPVILVGSTKDPETGEFTYGGVKRTSSWHPGKFALVAPDNRPLSCDAMNGNIVLISSAAADLVGEMDPVYSHSMGDYDYGMSLCEAGGKLYVASGFHGHCPRNPPGGAWSDQASFGARWKQVNTPKGLPFKEWAHFLRKHGSLLWPLAWLSTYRHLFIKTGGS